MRIVEEGIGGSCGAVASYHYRLGTGLESEWRCSGECCGRAEEGRTVGSSVHGTWALVAWVVTCDDECSGVRCLDQRPMSGGRASTPGPRRSIDCS